MARVLLNWSPCADPFPFSSLVRRLKLRRTVTPLLMAAMLAGCETRREVAVRVSIPDIESRETPAAGVGVIALPYDRDSILASLEARARAPRPQTAALDSLFARFRGPFIRYTSVSYRASQLRDSLEHVQQTLHSSSATGSAQLGLMRDSLRSLNRQVERARSELERARADFVGRSESLRTAVRRWEDSTYRGYDSIVENLSKAQGREAATDTTDQTGWAHFTLPAGDWWLYATAWDAGDPNSVWYWNVPVKGDTILLSSRTGKQKPRY